MKDSDKTKEQLISDLNEARQRVNDLRISASITQLIGSEFVSDSEKKIFSERRRCLITVEFKDEIAIDIVDDLSGKMSQSALIVNVAGQISEIYGYEKRELEGRLLASFFPGDVDRIVEFLLGKREDGEFADITEKSKSDMPVHVDISLAVFVENRQLKRIRIAKRDISDVKSLQKRLDQSEEKIFRIFMAAPLVMVISRFADGKIIDVNNRFCDFFGYSRDEIIGKTSLDMEFWVDQSDRLMLQNDLIRSGIVMNKEGSFRGSDGKVRTGMYSAYELKTGEDHFIVFVMQDLSERKRAEEEIRKVNQTLEAIVNASPLALIALDREANVMIWSPASEKIFGWSKEEVIGGLNPIVPADKWDEFMAGFREDMESLSLRNKEIKRRTKSGELINVSLSTAPLYGEDGNIIGLLGVVEDITERKKVEEALFNSRQMLQLVLDNIPQRIFWKSRDLRYLGCNYMLAKDCGYSNPSELIGKTDYETASAVNAEKYRADDLEVMNTGISKLKYEEPQMKPDGSLAWLTTSKIPLRDKDGNVIAVLGMYEDITGIKKAEEDKKRLELQLLQSQKMESIGAFAGGIAHDFNNILSAIMGYAELALNNLGDLSRVKSDLRGVLKACDRARDLAKQILAFSRKTDDKYAPLQIHIVVRESVKMLKSVVPKNIVIKTAINASGMIMSDQSQLHQVIMNLCTNSVQAIGMKDGFIEIRLERISVREGQDNLPAGLKEGDFFKLTVSDNGGGINPENMEKIFEPYFTTKEKGSGTGLGLAVVHGIVKSHSGSVICSSIPGEGTVFDIYFPEIKHDKNQTDKIEDELILTGNENILFVDDEPILARLAKEMLGGLGYNVMIRTSSVKALELFRHDPNGFDLIITDMTMPEMSGEKLIMKILKIRHDIPIIVCTGYSEYLSEDKARLIGIREFIYKPLEMKKIAAVIRKVLDSR